MSQDEPWERLLDRADRTLGRGNGIKLDATSRDTLLSIVKLGWTRAQKEGREKEYEQAGNALLRGISEQLREHGFRRDLSVGHATTEYANQGPRKAKAELLPPEEFRAAIGSLCPGFWPFC